MVVHSTGSQWGSPAERGGGSQTSGAAASASPAFGFKQVVDDFHRLYYDQADTTWRNTYFLGVPVQKCPFDLWIYQELLYELRPDLVVEAGTYKGGSALYLASMLDLLGHGRVVTIDVSDLPGRPEHPRITYLLGSSVDPEILATVTDLARGSSMVLVILDSDHSAEHVERELHAYAPLVSLGSYLVVEDGNINGRPVLEGFGPGPGEAVDSFLARSNEFVPDRSREKFFMSFNPGGYLRRISGGPL